MTLFLQNLLSLSLEAAPWLVLGLALGGLMKALIPTQFLQRHLSGDGLGAITKATLLGAPLPLCSCGVIPAALGLRKAGASKSATAAFLVSTPETGIDSISITYAMMGPIMTIVRPIAALFSALAAGSLVAIFDREPSVYPTGQAGIEMEQGTDLEEARNCCGSQPVGVTSCCDNGESENNHPNSSCSIEAVNSGSIMKRGWGGIQYAFTQLLGDIVLWLAIGMLFAAASKTFLPADFLVQWGQGFTAMLVMLMAGIPMYICATASTPVAAGLMMAGVSPGVALVLLLTGPATNISTLGVISKEMGKRSMWLYLVAVAVTALATGISVDALINLYQIDVLTHVNSGHEGLPVWLQWSALLLLIVAVVIRKLPRSIPNRVELV